MEERAYYLMKKMTRHKEVHFTERCNMSIFWALAIAKKINHRPNILIPDSGGWISFKKYPHFFNFTVKELKTDYGIIDLEELEQHAKSASALLVTSFAGYFAEQPLKKISQICKENNCLLIEDASGAVGDHALCNGHYSDIIIGSFGRWKPVEVGYGGFISAGSKEYFEAIPEAMSLSRTHPFFLKELLPKLTNNKLKKLLMLSNAVKKDLAEFQVIHKDRRGVNVAVKINNDDLPKLMRYCKEHNYESVLCPNYTRVNDKAISIELKRLIL